MKLKIASYNVSGGFYIGDESTEYLDREASDKIDNRLLIYEKFTNLVVKH